MSLYLWLDLIAVSVPFALSFEKNLRYYKKWLYLFSATFMVMIPFLIWDAWFVKNNFWSFNPDYLVGLHLFDLPIEEILFFIVVPYASLFAYYAIKFHFPRYILNKKIGSTITMALLFFSVLLVVFNLSRMYTALNFSFFAFALLLSYIVARETLFRFFAVFPVLLLPFFIMNGILTGTGIEGQVVWYNADEFMGFRIGTIPFEDIFYAFSLLILVLVLKEWLEKMWTKQR